MVQITPEEVMAQRKERQQLEEMSDWEMQRLPRGLRIDIPLASVIELRKVVPLLRMFADVIERETHRRDQTPMQILWHIWGVNRTLRSRIEEVCKTRAPIR